MYRPLKHGIRTRNKILYRRLFEPKVLTKTVHVMDTLYEVLISTCKKHLQKFTLHKQTCNLNQKMQYILIENVKVNYKNNVTCPPLAFIALHFIEVFPWFQKNYGFHDQSSQLWSWHTKVNQKWIWPANHQYESDYCNKTAFAAKQLCTSRSCVFAKGLYKPVEHFWVLEQAFLIRNMLKRDYAFIWKVILRTSNTLSWRMHAFLSLWVVN